MRRREFLQAILGAGAGLLLLPLKALAAVWNKPAFESQTLAGAIAGLHAESQQASAQIELIAPDFAENGAVVQIEVRSHVPNTEAIAILVEKNPTPLIANFMFGEGAEPFVVTRIKMAETSEIQAIIKSGEQYFKAVRKVEVAEGGCN